MLSTHSKFYYNYEVDSSAYNLAFKEGAGPELIAELQIGSYTLTDFIDEVERAFNDTDGAALTYTVTVNRTTRIITVAATGTFSLLVATGSTLGTEAYTTMGFTGADRTAAATYNGNLGAGNSYSTQFKLQSYVPIESLQGASDGVVNKSATGVVEVVKFGTEELIKCNLRYVTSRALSGDVIRNNPTGYEDLITLMQFFTTKAPFEFMPDENDSSTFIKCILESTQFDKNGLKYEIKELYDRNLPGFYETGTLTFRKVE